MVKTLHVVNGTMWHNTFLGLWVAALRLVQRVGIILTEKVWSCMNSPGNIAVVLVMDVKGVGAVVLPLSSFHCRSLPFSLSLPLGLRWWMVEGQNSAI